MVMDISFFDAFKALAEPIGTISGAVYALYRVSHKLKKDREHENAKILQEAKESVAATKLELDNDIEALKVEIQTLKSSTATELAHIKETNNNEIASLAEKIQLLRDDLRTQHVSLMTLVTKLIDKT